MTMLGGFGGSKAVDAEVAALITGLKGDVEKVGPCCFRRLRRLGLVWSRIDVSVVCVAVS